MTESVRNVVKDAGDKLSAAAVSDATREAALLLAYILNEDAGFLHRAPERILTSEERKAFDLLINRRSMLEPLSHLTGHREFWSLDFLVSADVLDPRADSETLIDAVLALCGDTYQPQRILDLGAGSGCLLLSLLSELSEANGVGIDKSEAALAIARQNAVRLGLDRRAVFCQGNWNTGTKKKFDLVVSNPPYIPTGDIQGLQPEVRDYEPHLALIGGPDGLDCYREILSGIHKTLQPGGLLVFEVGAGQAPDVGRMMQEVGFLKPQFHKDLSAIERCVSAFLAD